MPFKVLLASALGLPVRALGGRRGWTNSHCSSLSSRNSIPTTSIPLQLVHQSTIPGVSRRVHG